MIRVAIDVSPFELTRAGTARYLHALTAALEADPGLELHRHAFPGSGRATAVLRDTLWYQALLPLRARGDDVLHCPTFRAPLTSPVPLVVTFHDLAVLRYPEAFNRWSRTYAALTLPRIVRAADAIIAVSEFTRNELVELLDVPQGKLRVIPHGIPDGFAPDGRAAEGDFVLAVSTLEPRKNLARLVEGFRRADLDGCELRVVGARGWGGVRVEDGDRVRWLGEVSDEELARLYRGARCAAYVSLYEGFGLPVLEAMACGTPVVASDIPPLLEVAGDASIAVDPLDADMIAAGLEEAIARKDELASRGVERAARFSWREAARSHAELYREVAR
ncbi:MAG: glycosyltransferase family 1 protein [Gaiellaceae bacterium]